MGIELLEKPKHFSKYYSKEAGDKEARVNFEAIAELQGPLEKILEQIGSQNFDLIIGDDASGRIPSLILSKFFKAKAEKEGRKLPQTIFIAGGTRGHWTESDLREVADERKTEITPLLKKTKESFDDTETRSRALIVTDTVDTGDTLLPIIEALKEQSFKIHVATVGAIEKKTPKTFKKRFGVDIACGMIGTPKIWKNYKLGGVKTKVVSDIHSQPIKKPTPITEEPSQEAIKIQKTINLSREDANIIADRLIEKFLV